MITTLAVARRFSPELKQALVNFGYAHLRATNAQRHTVVLNSGETFPGATVPRSIDEDMQTAKENLLAFVDECPALSRIDLTARGREITTAMADEPQDEIDLELGAALEEIRHLELAWAELGLKLASEENQT
jgi:hypothetical protein